MIPTHRKLNHFTRVEKQLQTTTNNTPFNIVVGYIQLELENGGSITLKHKPHPDKKQTYH